jgi:DDE superfamily endonuclease
MIVLSLDKTYAYTNEQCHGGKYSKERVTVMVGSNMTGTDKLKLLVIGKSKNPRAMKNVRKESLPVDYESNKKAWMVSDVYKRWLSKLDEKFSREHRKILLFLDNCSGLFFQNKESEVFTNLFDVKFQNFSSSQISTEGFESEVNQN